MKLFKVIISLFFAVSLFVVSVMLLNNSKYLFGAWGLILSFGNLSFFLFGLKQWLKN
jgi:hypothetical protein